MSRLSLLLLRVVTELTVHSMAWTDHVRADQPHPLPPTGTAEEILLARIVDAYKDASLAPTCSDIVSVGQAFREKLRTQTLGELREELSQIPPEVRDTSWQLALLEVAHRSPMEYLQRLCDQCEARVRQVESDMQAIHESGHTLLFAWRNASLPRSFRVTQHVVRAELDLPLELSQESLEWLMLLHLAGKAAEAALGVRSSGADTDRTRWEPLATQYLERGFHFRSPSATPPLPARYVVIGDRPMDRLWRDQFAVALWLLRANVDLLRELADVLRQQGALSRANVLPYIRRVNRMGYTPGK
jgi:hypothetical protein